MLDSRPDHILPLSKPQLENGSSLFSELPLFLKCGAVLVAVEMQMNTVLFSRTTQSGKVLFALNVLSTFRVLLMYFNCKNKLCDPSLPLVPMRFPAPKPFLLIGFSPEYRYC